MRTLQWGSNKAKKDSNFGVLIQEKGQERFWVCKNLDYDVDLGDLILELFSDFILKKERKKKKI